jgi:hypothetical protein
LKAGLELLKYRTDALGRPPHRRSVLSAPEAAGHQHHVAVFLSPQLRQPLLAGPIVGVAEQPELVALRGETAEQHFGG